MPCWARIPPDKLINLPLFGIDVIATDGDLIWMSGPHGRMLVDANAPRILFEDVADAHQAGATAIMIGSEAERVHYERLLAEAAERLAAVEEQKKAAGEAPD